MKRWLLGLWLLLPVAGVAYHFGPGQELLQLDRASDLKERAYSLLERARAVRAKEGDSAAREHFERAEEAFTQALAALPATRAREGRLMRLERSKARMQISRLPEARAELETLLLEWQRSGDGSPEQLADLRETLANAQYYTTWLLRLEGEPRDVWEPEIESARQHLKLLAEEAERAGATQRALELSESLEATQRLARLDLTELQGLPLPSV